MIPYDYQEELSDQALDILKKHAICYLSMEERTGKTLVAILMAEKSESIKRVLVITKKKALEGWHETLEKFTHTKNYTVTNYHQAKKISGNYDLVILDESHNYLSGYPKPSGIWKDVAKLTAGKPLIYVSATPYAQGTQLLYHQFKLSSWSPWSTYKTYYSWFRTYGIPKTMFLYGRQVQKYDSVKTDLVLAGCQHLFLSYTRKQLGFGQEPEDRLHMIKLDDKVKAAYNKLVDENYLAFAVDGKDWELVCDTPMKLRTSLHMLEGGVAKVEDNYISLRNNEKINYIKEHWGDTYNVAIMYQYIEEGNKLRRQFDNAAILQATSFAEGVDLSHIEHLVIYSQDFSTARHTQRRARQANKRRELPIIVHYLLVEGGVSEQVYETVSVNKTNFVDSVFDRSHV
ncbi:MAG: DEAD/DEAH box helicase family protein [Dehalococcoidales bacterium]